MKNKDTDAPNRSRIQIQFDIDYDPFQSNITGDSQTVPDLNLTVRQLLTNHSRGLTNGNHEKSPLYFDYKLPKINDLTDVQEHKNYLLERIEVVNQFIADEKADKAKQLDLEEEIERQENQEKAEKLQKDSKKD